MEADRLYPARQRPKEEGVPNDPTSSTSRVESYVLSRNVAVKTALAFKHEFRRLWPPSLLAA